uniref:Uncharacterized protein n=1 Tax=Arundo donax TaxID=35708 RepID=A0A0A9EXB6_ARUDO
MNLLQLQNSLPCQYCSQLVEQILTAGVLTRSSLVKVVKRVLRSCTANMLTCI